MPNENSKDLYERTFNLLVKRSGSKSPKEILAFIKKTNVKTPTKLVYLNSLVGLDKLGYDVGSLDEVKKYRDSLKEKYDADGKKISDKQQKAIDNISYDDLVDVVDKLYEEINGSIKSLEAYLLLSLMIKTPLRNDLAEVVVTKKESDLKKKDFNWIFVGKDKCEIRINEHKTSRTNGFINHTVDERDCRVLKYLLKRDPDRIYLFETGDNEPLTSSNFTHRLNNLTKKQFGIPISSSILRKIYLTHKYADVQHEMEQDAIQMGHSVKTQQEEYVVRDKKKK